MSLRSSMFRILTTPSSTFGSVLRSNFCTSTPNGRALDFLTRIKSSPAVQFSATRSVCGGISSSTSAVPRSIVLSRSPNPLYRNSSSILLCSSQRRMFRTTPPLKAIPPVLLLILSRAGKYVAVFFGRMFRNWWHKLPPEEKAQYTGRARNYRRFFYGLAGILGIGGYMYYYTHIVETPITKRKRFLAFSDDQIDEISKHELEILIDTHRKHILPPTDKRHQRVVSVAQRLVGGNKDVLELYGKDKDWTVTVVEDDTINAFVLSCGNIFVFTGILKLCEESDGDSDSALAIILGHELSHVLLNHSAEQASFLHLVDMLFIIPMAALWALIPSDATAAFSQWVIGNVTDLLFALPFGRSLETEADEVGLILAARACFDIRECLIWKKMELMNNKEDMPGVELFSTHPSNESRFENLQSKLPNAMEFREKCGCPKLPFFDLSRRIRLLEHKVGEKRAEVLVPLKLREPFEEVVEGSE